jgi:pimeloyl-ACP methyl ester carboxylesterase
VLRAWRKLVPVADSLLTRAAFANYVPIHTMQEHLLDVEGHKIAALTANADRPGTPIVFIHGILASVKFWVPSLPEAVRTGAPWISLSLPGHFPSLLPPDCRDAEITAEMFARVHAGALDQLIPGRPAALVGWSTGGFSVLNLAAQRPKHVKSVMSLCGFADGRWAGIAGAMQRLASLGGFGNWLFQRLVKLPARTRKIFRWGFARAACNRRAYYAAPALEESTDALYDALRSHDVAAMARLFRGIRQFDIRPKLAQISVPALIVGGEKDPFIPLAHTQEMAEKTPGARLVVWERTGHMFYAERTREYWSLLLDWLNRTAGYAFANADPASAESASAEPSVP